MNPLGIMAALHDEIAVLLQEMDDGVVTHRIGQRDYHEGRLYGQPCVVVLARIGKVAAAATAVTLIREFNVQNIVFAGVAGGVTSDVRVGDIVVATHLLQHDIDASPIFPRYEVPLLQQSRFAACGELSQRLASSAQAYLDDDFSGQVSFVARQEFNLVAPTVHIGTIISGDQFVNDSKKVRALADALPDALCVEMEGAAVAQICFEYDIPFAVFRTISDSADHTASTDFSAFLGQVARYYSAGVLRRFLAHERQAEQLS